jgi:glucose/arabinose dehydrogenase
VLHYYALLYVKLSSQQLTGMYPVPGSNKLWLVNQSGTVNEVDNNPGASDLALVLSIDVLNHDEQGLLGLAFSPDFATTGRFYMNYIDGAGNTVVARYTRGGDPGATAASRQQLMYLLQWQPNHNGYVALSTDHLSISSV